MMHPNIFNEIPEMSDIFQLIRVVHHSDIMSKNHSYVRQSLAIPNGYTSPVILQMDDSPNGSKEMGKSANVFIKHTHTHIYIYGITLWYYIMVLYGIIWYNMISRCNLWL